MTDKNREVAIKIADILNVVADKLSPEDRGYIKGFIAAKLDSQKKAG